MNRGLLQFYVGDGKGKSTAIIGQVVRAHGNGMKCAVYQFLKSVPSGETEALVTLGVPVVERAVAENSKFFYQMSATEKGAFLMQQRALYTRAVRAIRSGEYDLVALDEILDLLEMGGIDLDALRMALVGRPNHVEVLLSGRRMPRELNDIAGYITETRAVKHPFNDGIPARQGIEF